jgi:tetratricopeptide (TPR) repeat protein
VPAESAASTGIAAVAALHSRGVTEHNLGRPLRASHLFRRARASLERSPELAASEEGRVLDAALWISLALLEAEVHGVERGLAALEEAGARAARVGDPGLLVRLHSQTAHIAIRAGRFDLALSALEAAEAMIEFSDRNDHFAILLNSGNLRMFRGELAAARGLLEQAARFARREQMRDEQFKSLHNLGYLEFLAGDLPRALRLMDEAARANLSVSRGIAQLDLARVLVDAGLAREADDALAAAADIFRREQLAQDLGEVYLERARCALILDDVRAARRYAGRARDRFRRRGNDRWRRSAELVLLQGDLAAGRPGSRLVPPALRLQTEFEKDGLRLPARTAALIAVEAHLATGDVGAAEGIVTKLGPPGRGDPITARLHSLYVEARLAAARGDGRTASRKVRTGLAELAAYQASFGSIDLKTASAVHGSRLAELGLSVALGGGRPAEVFAAAERARAVSSRLPAVRPPADAPTAELLAELRQTVESLREAMQDAAASAALLRRRRELERAITARHWTLAGSGSALPTVRIDAVRAAASAAATTMVVFVEAAGVMHAVVIRDGRLRLHELGSAAATIEQIRRTRADLDVLAQSRLPAALAAAVRKSFDRSADELDRTLLAPLQLDGRALVLVSTGILGQLPWGTLPSLRGVPVVVAPSATAWLNATEGNVRRRRHNVFGLAGPDLSRAEQEVAGIEKAWGTAAVHVGGAASRPAFTRAMTRGSIVHIAAHGVHQTENPMFSSLRLADGPIFAHEMDQTARTPEHVILSACELGLATVRPGDEALGLTSVLLHLGTRSVVAGVARVGDDLAADTMIAYHERLAAGDDSALALATATSNADSPVPFVCFGSSWRARR